MKIKKGSRAVITVSYPGALKKRGHHAATKKQIDIALRGKKVFGITHEPGEYDTVRQIINLTPEQVADMINVENVPTTGTDRPNPKEWAKRDQSDRLQFYANRIAKTIHPQAIADVKIVD